jgi:hypothetical protein
MTFYSLQLEADLLIAIFLVKKSVLLVKGFLLSAG